MLIFHCYIYGILYIYVYWVVVIYMLVYVFVQSHINQPPTLAPLLSAVRI